LQVEYLVAVGAVQLDAAAELAHGAVTDGDAVVTGPVGDPDLAGHPTVGEDPVDDVAAEVDGDVVGADDQPVSLAVEQVGAERGVLGEHRPAAHGLGACRAGGPHQGEQQRRDGQE
jgi:hypothetical protein